MPNPQPNPKKTFTKYVWRAGKVMNATKTLRKQQLNGEKRMEDTKAGREKGLSKILKCWSKMKLK